MQTFQEFEEQLPPDIRREVRNFAEFLLEKRRKRQRTETRKPQPGRVDQPCAPQP